MEKKRKSTATIKKGGTHGVRSQKNMTFRLDNDLLEFLNTKVNKGRFINNLIRAAMGAQEGQE